MGARRRACGLSSPAYVRSINGVSRPRASAVRVESGEPARKADFVSPKASESKGASTVGSPSNSVSSPVSSAPEAIKLRRAGKWLVANMSRISRPSSVSLPTRAIVSIFDSLLANLALRVPRGRNRTQAAPHDAGDPDDNPAADIETGKNQQDRLRAMPDEVNQAAQPDHDHKRARAIQINVLKAVVAPRADHEE